MSVHDPYASSGDDAADLPPLPIPRPGEWSAMHSVPGEPAVPPVSPPRLLGASFTAASTGSEPAAPSVDPPQTTTEFDRLPWELAAQLTAGMLANPGRAHASVKDAMGLFDQLLHELHAYARMAAENDLHASDRSSRRTHGEYFQRHGERAAEDAAAPAQPGLAQVPPPTAPKAAPTQPRPAGPYQPIPPGTRGPYAPGSMAGPPPVDVGDADHGSGSRAA